MSSLAKTSTTYFNYFLLGAGEEYNFCNQPTQDKYINK